MRPAIPLLALLPTVALGGCVAAAIPVVAGGMVAKRTADGGEQASPAAVAEPVAVASPVAQANEANLTESWVAAAIFAADRAGAGKSMLANPATTGEDDLLKPCNGQPPALLVDLDPGEVAFRPANDNLVARGLGQALAVARTRGVAVLWISWLDESREPAIRDALRRSGLDPDGTDPVLLIRDPAETKTERRNAAAGDWCITAIVGDRPTDFDVLFEYLRDPSEPTPFDPLFGNGWFELPPPLKPAA